jgi:hypothetical protein
MYYISYYIAARIPGRTPAHWRNDMKKSVFAIASALSLYVSAVSAAPIEPCPVAKSCTQAKQICETGSNRGCSGMFESCKQSGIVGNPPRACTVPTRN